MDAHRRLMTRFSQNLTASYPLPLEIDGRLIKNVLGDTFRVKGLTAFPFIEKFATGQNLDWIWKYFPATNLVRAFWYTPKAAWGDSFWDLPTPDEAYYAHVYAANRGIYIYNTCLTDYADSNKVKKIQAIIARLRDSRLPNVLFEAKNEPYTHDDLNPVVLVEDLAKTPYIYTSGIYADDKLSEAWGRFCNNHVPRDAESVRKFKDLEDLYNTLKLPVFEGEPFKLPGYSDLDFYTFAAGCGFMGSGGIYHCQSMETLDFPDTDEIRCGNLFLNGLDLFPLETQLGSYVHRQDLELIINNEPTSCLRCFQKGNHAIVVRKNEKFVVPFNWKSLDPEGVGYQIL